MSGRGGRKQMKPGDWICPCGEHNFASRVQCRSCNSRRPAGGNVGFKHGDWHCGQCGEHNFASRQVCRKCESPPDSDSAVGGSGYGGSYGGGYGGGGYNRDFYGGGGGSRYKPGDWTCTSCREHNFASRTECRKCMNPKSSAGIQMLPGDWLCAECNEHNFASRGECRKCGAPNTQEDQGRGGYGSRSVEVMPGDWHCPQCGEHNFGSRQVCRQCDSTKSQADVVDVNVCMNPNSEEAELPL